MTDILWSPLAGLSEDEPPLCLSLYYPAPGGVRLGPLACEDYVGHPESGGPGSDHSTGAPGFPFWWNDAMALESLAEFGPSAVKTGPLCTVCNDLPQSARGLCASCAAAELARDDIETSEEAA